MKWHIAHINIATALYPEGDQRIEEFYSRIDEINELADRSEGFVWRYETDATDPDDDAGAPDPLLIVNMSVWESIESLFDYAYKSAHRTVMAKRREWFEKPSEAYQVLWWVPEGHRPTVSEAMAKLRQLRDNGPMPEAFTFKTTFPAPKTFAA